LKAWPVLGITLIQALLLLAHWFIYHTWIAFWFELGPAAGLALRIVLFLLSLSFVVSALLGFRFGNLAVALLYKMAAVWLGLLNYFFLAACLCWLADSGLRLAGSPPNRPMLAGVLFALAVLTVIYGILNARLVRVQRVPIKLPNLPPSWRGRTAVLFSDLHLGHINNLGFMRRVSAMAARLKPDILFIPGDLFDGTPVDPDRLAAPLEQIAPPLGAFFVTGNHEEFGHAPQFCAALTRAGVRVLANTKVVVDGLAILGIPYHDSTYPLRVRTSLEGLRPSPGQPAILLLHVPNRLPIVEQAGISLQLSGHTHAGQLFPFTWFVRRAFGTFTYGLHPFGALQVLTTSGAGTWGPPMRVGTHPEIVLITFE
jgi:hypothetical protein